MSHLRAHQSGPAWKKSPTTTLQIIKRMISRQPSVCVGSGLSSHFLSARPPPRNLVIHPRALSVNKCRRRCLAPPSEERLCVEEQPDREPTGPPSASVCDWQQDFWVNQSENTHVPVWGWVFFFLLRFCLFLELYLQKDMNVKIKIVLPALISH